ncbi:hypothetical protein [Rhodococcoides fascians]|uniref:hypothetical protein n=1 Tax=Rhodococcoides fascians TaxID=1828 RepID=UPI00050CC94E|nr:hypothetical protein [Rhodococcus fascians]
MDIQNVTPDQIVIGDKILIETTEVDEPRGPRHFELNTVIGIEEPDKYSAGDYQFEWDRPHGDPKQKRVYGLFGANQLVPKVINLE